MKSTKFRSLIAAAVLATSLLAGGCSPSNRMSDAEMRAARTNIMSDSDLSDDEKYEKLHSLAESSEPNPMFLPGLIVCVASVFGGGAVAVRKRQSALEEAAQYASKQSGAYGKRKPERYEKPKPANRSASNRSRSAERSASTVAASALSAEPQKPKVHLPSTQAEVDAIPASLRGTSFFTSRPLPLNKLVDVTILVRNQVRVVRATMDEADLARAGAIPLVRAFTIDGVTLPWYDWTDYDPYTYYWQAVKDDWVWVGSQIIACWMSAENVDPRMTGYFGAPADSDLVESDGVILPPAMEEPQPVFPQRRRKSRASTGIAVVRRRRNIISKRPVQGQSGYRSGPQVSPQPSGWSGEIMRIELRAVDASLKDIEKEEKVAVQAQLAGVRSGASVTAYTGVFTEIADRRQELLDRKDHLTGAVEQFAALRRRLKQSGIRKHVRGTRIRFKA